MSEAVHATAVLVGARGVLIRGAPGSGKSTLAYGLIEGGARLVADDRVYLSVRSGRLLASAPAATAGRIELRGRGIVALPHERVAVVRLVVDLAEEEGLERLPDDTHMTAAILGLALPRQPAPARSARALLLVAAALDALGRRADMDLRTA